MGKKTATIMVVITLLLVASAVGFLKARQSTAGAVLPKEASDIVDAYMEAYAKGNSYSVE